MNDYADSAVRHFESAGLLQTQQPASASHCFGIAAECVLKALMCDLKPQAQKVSGKHLSTSLWTEFVNHQTLQTHPSRIALAQQHQASFNSWDVNQRYWNRTNAQFDAMQLVPQQRSAQNLVGLLQLIQRDLA